MPDSTEIGATFLMYVSPPTSYVPLMKYVLVELATVPVHAPDCPVHVAEISAHSGLDRLTVPYSVGGTSDVTLYGISIVVVGLLRGLVTLIPAAVAPTVRLLPRTISNVVFPSSSLMRK